MPITLDGTTGIVSPGYGAVTGTTGTFSGNVTANGLSTELRPLVLGTAQASTSGTSIDFTGIPSWANRVTASFAGLSTTGISAWQLSMGTSGGIESTGYLGTNTNLSSGPSISASNFTTGINIVNASSSGTTLHGTFTFTRLTGNTWVFYGVSAFSDGAATAVVAGSKTLSGAFERLRFATGNATTWDAGTINIMRE